MNSLTVKMVVTLYDVCLCLNSKISLFENAEPSFIRALARVIRPVYLLRGEYIIRTKDMSFNMFFIYRGKVYLLVIIFTPEPTN